MREHSALILKPETDSRGLQRAAFNVRTVVPYLEYYHTIPTIMETESIWDILTSIFGIYQHMIPNRSKRKEFSGEIPCEFQKKMR